MFWDSSAIILLCIDEPHIDDVQQIVKKDTAMVARWGSPVECFSAFARLHRDGFLNDTEEDQVRQIVDLLSSTWTEIEPSQDIRNMAGRLLHHHSLRTADSLQLAAALVWAAKNPKDHYFVLCLDADSDKLLRKKALTFYLLNNNPLGSPYS